MEPLPYDEDEEIVKSLQSPFRDALTNTQALVIDFSQNSRIDEDDTNEVTPFRRFCTMINMKDSIDKCTKLRHVILGNARNFNYLYDCWLEELGILTLQRPVTFSLVHCNLIKSNINSELRGEGTFHQLFPTFMGEGQLGQVSLTSPLRERLFRHRMLLAVKDLIFPYPSDQLAWLKACRIRLENEGKLDFGNQNVSKE